MSIKQYPGGIITKNPTAPTTLAATGIWTIDQATQNIKAGTWPIPASGPTVIGQAFGGGFYAGQISTAGNGVADYYLIVGPVASAVSGTLKWKSSDSGTPGADSFINGPQNTADIVADGNSTTYPAAYFCNDLSTGGQTDWYMPAKNELEVCYYNLKPTTTSNFTNSGTNPNAVPARASNYTAGNPAQTSAAAFQAGGAETFSYFYYWSSTDYAPNSARAWNQYFGAGYQYNPNKSSLYRTRAVRRVAV